MEQLRLITHKPKLIQVRIERQYDGRYRAVILGREGFTLFWESYTKLSSAKRGAARALIRMYFDIYGAYRHILFDKNVSKKSKATCS